MKAPKKSPDSRLLLVMLREGLKLMASISNAMVKLNEKKPFTERQKMQVAKHRQTLLDIRTDLGEIDTDDT